MRSWIQVKNKMKAVSYLIAGAVAALTVLAVVASASDATSRITSALRNHEYAQAVELARQALRQTPDDFAVLTLEGMALSSLGKEHAAMKSFRSALKLRPDYLPALEGAAQLAYKSGSAEAIPLLDRLLSRQPNEQTTHAMRAVLAWEQHDCRTAVHHFELSKDAIASQPEAQRDYGACLVRLERPGDAIPIFGRLAAGDPTDHRAIYTLASAQLMAKAWADALATLQPLLQGHPPDPQALDLASTAWEALGDTPRAVAALHQAIVLEPRNPVLYVDFASLSLAHKSFQVGLDMLDAGLRQMPDAAQLYTARGVLRVQLAQYEQADADFAMADQLDPRHSYGPAARGLAQVERNDFDQALATVREQLKTKRDDAFLYYLLAEIQSSRGAAAGSAEFREAIEAASRALQIKPDFTLARHVLARLYTDAGQTSKAIEQCRLALRSDPVDATAMYRLIRALQSSARAGNADEIAALLKRFKETRLQLQKQEAQESRYVLIEGDVAGR